MRIDHSVALRRVRDIWGTQNSLSQSERVDVGPIHQRNAHKHIAAKIKRSKDVRHRYPYSELSCPSASLYSDATANSLQKWLCDLSLREEKPNTEQAAFLTHVVQRVEFELGREQGIVAAEDQTITVPNLFEQRNNVLGNLNEPCFDVVHGVPGAGKSKIISWMKELFQCQLGWEHGVQFVCVAFQNAMAAAIGGSTIHHWMGLDPFDETGPLKDAD